MAELLSAKGVLYDRIAVVRNWVDLDQVKPIVGISSYRRELGIRETDFVVLYSGSIGAKQGFEHLLAAIAKLEGREDIIFIIAGEGPAKTELMARNGSATNLKILPFAPPERFSDFLGVADMHVLPQRPGAADLVLPSKLGAALASGRRIVVTAAVGSELATFLDGAAIIVPPGNADALAEAIRQGADDPSFGGDDPERRSQLARQLSKLDALSNIRFGLVEPAGWRASHSLPRLRPTVGAAN
jgi:colanic acid biosynthesis glycosyl transferase WcaI